MKEIIKNIGIYVGTFIGLIIIFILVQLLTSLIPSKYIEENVRTSSEILIKDGEKKIIDLGYKYETLFLFTDALMINTAYSVDSTHPYYSFMMARKNYIPGQTLEEHEETQYHVGTSEKYKDEQENTFQTQELYGLMHGDNITDSYDYARYWHGYLSFLRPLLLAMNIQGIRIFFKILIIILLAILVFLITKKINLITAIIYLFTMVALSILTVAESINEITTFIIAISAGIFILLKDGKFKRPGLAFMCIGGITSFADLLTTPIVTLGFTLPIYILLNLREENKKLYKDFLQICIAWALGFGLTWAFKWILTDITLGKNVIQNALSQFLYRLGDTKYNTKDIGIWETIDKNIKMWDKYIPAIFIGIIIIYIAIGIGKEIYLNKVKHEETQKAKISHIIVFILISIFPILWYAVVKNHSYIHTFFTYRDLSVFILNIQIAITMYLNLNSNENISNTKVKGKIK